jgi:branched-chain amino acid transport system substrate-binding protein
VKIGGSNLFKISLAMVFAGILVGCNGGSTENTETSSSTGSAPAPTDGGNSEGGSTSGKRPAPTAEGFKVDGETIKIACVASVSGDTKPWGDDQFAGAKLAVDEFNEAGGLQGKKIELILQDAGSKQDQAKTAAEKALGDKVIGIVGEVSSGNTIQIAKSAWEKGVPVIAVGATRTDLTDTGSNVWRVCYTDDFQGPVMAKFAYDKLNLRNIAVLTDNNLPYSQGLSASFKAKFVQLGGTIVEEAFYESGGKQAPEYSSQLTEIKAKNPDGLFCSGYFPEVGPIAQQAKKAGLNVKILGGDGWDSDQILVGGGDAILGGYFCNHYNNADTRTQVQDFLKKWRAKNNGRDPATTMGALGYDATALMLDALKRAKSLDSKALMAAIEETNGYQGVSGEISLKGNNGNPPKRAIVVEVTKKNGANWQKFAVDYTPDTIK